MKTFSVLLFLLSFNTVYCQDWKWIEPSPQGNNLTCVTFADANTVYAAGDFGTIIKSTDAGLTWNTIRSGGEGGFNNLYFTDANNGYAVGYPSAILKTTDGGISWISKFSAPAGYISSICFSDPNTAYAVGYKTILKSTNGGESWNEISDSTFTYHSVYFLPGSDTGFIAGETGLIQRTIDGGNHWTLLPTGVAQTLNAITFVNHTTGYAVGNGGTILKTIDGGTSWVPQFVETQANLSSVCFSDVLTGYIVSSDAEILITNDGVNWLVQQTYAYTTLSGITCSPQFKYLGIVVGNGGTIIRSPYQWTVMDRINHRIQYPLYSVWFLNNETGYIGGRYGLLLKSIDRGNHWNEVTPGIEDGSRIYDICFVDSLTGFITGSQGHYFKTINGGTNWTRYPLPWSSIDLTSILFISADTGFIAAYDLWKTVDKGVTWKIVLPWVPPSFPKYVTAMHFPTHNTGFAVGTGIWRTNDSGESWTELATPGYYGFNAVWFTDSLTGYVCGINGTILKTIDAGQTWNSQNSQVTSTLNSITFDQGTGYIVGDAGTILKSTNGGDWIKQTPMLANNLTKVYFTKDHTGFITGMDGTILRMGNNETGITGKEKVRDNLRIYPNPASDLVTIDLSSISGKKKISIYNTTGGLIRELIVTGNMLDINLEKFAAGLYYVTVQSGKNEKTVSGKILKK